MKIAITGPAGSGKGAISRAIASRAGFYYVDAGLVFRAIAWLISNNDLRTVGQLRNEVCEYGLCYSWDGVTSSVSIHGKCLGDILLGSDVSRITAELASSQRWFTEMKTTVESILIGHKDVVVDGRNAGTSVLPDADFIFYIEVNSKVRAQRRAKQLGMTSREDQEKILREIVGRDCVDADRKFEAYTVPKSAIVVSNDGTLQACLDAILDNISV